MLVVVVVAALFVEVVAPMAVELVVGGAVDEVGLLGVVEVPPVPPPEDWVVVFVPADVLTPGPPLP